MRHPLLSRIGDTPLVELQRIPQGSGLLRAARDAGAKTVALILPDGGERHLSEGFWETR